MSLGQDLLFGLIPEFIPRRQTVMDLSSPLPLAPLAPLSPLSSSLLVHLGADVVKPNIAKNPKGKNLVELRLSSLEHVSEIQQLDKRYGTSAIVDIRTVQVSKETHIFVMYLEPLGYRSLCYATTPVRPATNHRPMMNSDQLWISSGSKTPVRSQSQHDAYTLQSQRSSRRLEATQQLQIQENLLKLHDSLQAERMNESTERMTASAQRDKTLDIFQSTLLQPSSPPLLAAAAAAAETETETTYSEGYESGECYESNEDGQGLSQSTSTSTTGAGLLHSTSTKTDESSPTTTHTSTSIASKSTLKPPPLLEAAATTASDGSVSSDDRSALVCFDNPTTTNIGLDFSKAADTVVKVFRTFEGKAIEILDKNNITYHSEPKQIYTGKQVIDIYTCDQIIDALYYNEFLSSIDRRKLKDVKAVRNWICHPAKMGTDGKLHVSIREIEMTANLQNDLLAVINIIEYLDGVYLDGSIKFELNNSAEKFNRLEESHERLKQDYNDLGECCFQLEKQNQRKARDYDDLEEGYVQLEKQYKELEHSSAKKIKELEQKLRRAEQTPTNLFPDADRDDSSDSDDLFAGSDRDDSDDDSVGKENEKREDNV